MLSHSKPRALTLLTLLSVLVLPARAGDPQKVTEERVQAAFADARSALESVCGVRIDPQLVVRIVSAEELGKRVAEENLPIVRLRQPDEEKAKAEAKSIGDNASALMFAKYSWTPRGFLVVPATLELSAKQLGRPELTSDEVIRSVMVHELVHAWDDSVHDFAALLSHSDSIEATSAISAVIEGHAQRVTRRVCQVRGWSGGFETFTAGIGALPESLKLLGEAAQVSFRQQSAAALFTYGAGEKFMAALDAAGGAEGMTRAFRDPPRDGETILHPEWYLDPKQRPAVLYDAEPALDLFVTRFPSSEWSSQRQSNQSDQMEVGFALLPKEEAHALATSIRSARLVMLYPTAAPTAKLAAVTVLEFGSEAEARSFLEAGERLDKLKDERMKTGIVRITGSSSSTLQAPGMTGVLRTKQMKNRSLAFEVHTVDLQRGRVVVETLFSGEPIAMEEHVQLAVNLLSAVKLRGEK